MTTRPIRVVPCSHEHAVTLLRAGNGWLWTRYVVDGTALEPRWLWDFWRAGDSVEFIARSYGICPEQVQAAVDWCEKRSAAAKRGARIRHEPS